MFLFNRKSVKYLRILCGLTQLQLSEKIGVSRQTITSIEGGKMLISKTMQMAMIGCFYVMTEDDEKARFVVRFYCGVLKDF